MFRGVKTWEFRVCDVTFIRIVSGHSPYKYFYSFMLSDKLTLLLRILTSIDQVIDGSSDSLPTWQYPVKQFPVQILKTISSLSDRASLWQLKNKRPTWCHLLFYFTSYVLNMFRTLIYPSSTACVELPHWSYCFWFDVCWSFGVVGLEWLEWYPCCRLKHWFSLQHGYHSNPTTPKLQHTLNQEQHHQCGNSTAQS